MRILITGANGFLGSHLVEHALSDHHEVFAGIRQKANLRFIDNFDVKTIILDYQNSHKLTNQLINLLKTAGVFDIIIHNAGLTKSNSLERNLEVNKGITDRLISAINESNILSKKGKLLYVSSMAALGPVGFNGPISAYGTSKLKTEESIQNSKIPYLIFRPTAIYGPRDSAFLPLFKAAKMRLYPILTPGDQKLTMIHARDVARLMLHYSTKEMNRTIHLDDGNVYTHLSMRDAQSNAIGKKIRMFRIPLKIVKGAIYSIEKFTKLTGQTPLLTIDKYHEISQDWNHDFSKERKKLDQLSLVSLTDGFKEAYQYYIQHKLI